MYRILLPLEGIQLREFIRALENDLIKQALERTHYNRSQTARLLGLKRSTLIERLKARLITPLFEPSREL